MRQIDKTKCMSIGICSDRLTQEERHINVDCCRLTWDLIEAMAEADDVPVSVMLRQILDAWAAREILEKSRIADFMDGSNRAAQRKQLLYFVQKGGAGPIKIGVSSDVDGRIRQLSTGSDERIRLLAAIEQTEEVNERALHAKFAGFRKNGEWFEPCGELLEFIDRMKNSVVYVGGTQ